MQRYYNLGSDLFRYRSVLQEILRDVKAGDRISAVYTPREALKFYHNGRYMGEIRDDRFAKRYMNIWLHPNAYYDNLRKSLLYGTS